MVFRKSSFEGGPDPSEHFRELPSKVRLNGAGHRSLRRPRCSALTLTQQCHELQCVFMPDSKVTQIAMRFLCPTLKCHKCTGYDVAVGGRFATVSFLQSLNLKSNSGMTGIFDLETCSPAQLRSHPRTCDGTPK